MTETIHSSPPVEFDFLHAPLKATSSSARLEWLRRVKSRGPVEQFLRYAVVGGIDFSIRKGRLFREQDGT